MKLGTSFLLFLTDRHEQGLLSAQKTKTTVINFFVSWTDLLTAAKTPDLIEMCAEYNTNFLRSYSVCKYYKACNCDITIKTVCISKQGIYKHIPLEVTVNSFIKYSKANRLKIVILNHHCCQPPPPPKHCRYRNMLRSVIYYGSGDNCGIRYLQRMSLIS